MLRRSLARVMPALALVLVLALIFALALALAGRSPTGQQPTSDSPSPSPALFVIADPQGMARGWLFGTIHALPDGTPWRSAAIGEAADQADSLVVEVANLDDHAVVSQTFSQLGTSPDLPLLAARVPPAHQQRLAELVEAAGLTAAQQRRTESWAAALMLARVATEGDPAHGADRALIRDFAGRRVDELEGAAGQLAIFDTLPETAQRAMLTAVIEGSDPVQAHEAARLRRAWLVGDLAVIEAASRSGMMADPSLRDALLTQRNRAWMVQIVTMLESPGRPLIAVGAAHLTGPDGLIELLEARGYRVTRAR